MTNTLENKKIISELNYIETNYPSAFLHFAKLLEGVYTARLAHEAEMYYYSGKGNFGKYMLPQHQKKQFAEFLGLHHYYSNEYYLIDCDGRNFAAIYVVDKWQQVREKIHFSTYDEIENIVFTFGFLGNKQ